MPDDGIAALFGEDQARYVLTVAEKRAAAILADAKSAGVPARIIGTTGGGDLVLPNGDTVMVAQLRNAHDALVSALHERRSRLILADPAPTFRPWPCRQPKSKKPSARPCPTRM